MIGRAPSPQALALTAFFCGTLSGVFLKSVAATPPGQAVVLRTLAAFAVLALAVLLWPRPAGQRRVGRAGLLRAVLDAVAGLSFALAIFSLPLSLLASIHATLPILSVTLSALILSEPLGRRTLAALGLALAGTLLVLKPGLSFSALGIGLAIVSTLAFALRDIVTRRLAPDTDTRKVVLVSLGLVALAALGLARGDGWVLPGGGDAARIGLAAATFLCSTFLIVLALRGATVTRIAPLRYTSVIWALVFDAAIWGFVPGVYGWCGIALIVAAGALQHAQAA